MRDPKTSATLEKPLTRESLVNPDEHLSTPEGSGLFAARTPRLPRILQEAFTSLSLCKPRPKGLSIVCNQILEIKMRLWVRCGVYGFAAARVLNLTSTLAFFGKSISNPRAMMFE